MKILAIDPGTFRSAYVVYDTEIKLPVCFGIVDNDKMSNIINRVKDLYGVERMFCEMIASYGMAVGKNVFTTCLWIGRFMERFGPDGVTLIYRKDVKMFLCGQTKAKDANIRQAIMDMYGSDRKIVLGTKKNPGPLYGMSKDVWAAMGVALTAANLKAGV